MTWHDGAIPDSEICFKLRGDKGCATFKFAFQHLNLNSPNSSDNTFIFAAPDAYINLHICLDQYKEDKNIQKHSWQ